MPPSGYRPKLARDLEAICLKCLQKEPDRRYPSALALAEDLGRWLRGEPTLARPLRWTGRLKLALRRHPRTATLVAAGLLVAVAVLGILYYTDPDRPLRDIERRLARGEAVTLIGETGEPRWSRWRTGGDAGQTSLAEDGTFTIHTWKLSLLELVHNPGRKRYRIRAEVRHLKCGFGLSHVGIYCTHREYPTADGPIHRFTHLSFNDIIDDKEEHALLTKGLPRPPPPPAGNAVSLHHRLYRDGGPNTQWDQGIVGVDARLFQPVRPVGSVWRKLTVFVMPEGINAVWGDGQPVGELLTAELLAKTRETLARMRKFRPSDTTVSEVDPAFSARGSLGLHVLNGSASFRNVIIEPLGEAD
jgi:serine/threonine-protein kinase